MGSRDEGELVPKLVWRVRLVAEFETGETTEVEVARLERDEHAGLADLGLRLAEAKRLTAAIQAEIVPAQVTIAGEHRRTCVACAGASWPARDITPRRSARCSVTCQSGFGACSPVPARGPAEAKSFAAFDLEAATVAPELAYVTARYAALAPFGKVADLLSELLPISGARNAGTVRNRTMRVGEAVVQPNVTTTAEPATAKPAKPVVIGLDGGYVRSRHRQDERHFEVIAGKVIDAQGCQSRFAFARNSPAIASDAFRQALAVAGVTADTPATVLSDGDAGLWRLQRELLPNATVVLDWWHAAVRFEHALQAARGLGAALPTRTWPTRRFADWSGRNGACGTGVGRDAGANSRLCAAGRDVPMYRTWLASGAWNTTSASCWPTSSGTRERWSITPPGAGMANRSRPRSWRVRSTRSSPNA